MMGLEEGGEEGIFGERSWQFVFNSEDETSDT